MAIEVKAVSLEEMLEELKGRILKYEARYEMSSAQMLQLVSAGLAKETVAITKWMQAYHVYQSLKEQTPTTGTHGTTTETSMTVAWPNTPS